MARLDEVPIDALRAEMASFEEHRPMLRLLAAILYKSGQSVQDIAAWFDVREATVYAWFDRLEDADDLGAAARDRSRSGRPPKLSPSDREVARRQLAGPPTAAGVDATEWGVDQARQYLSEEFGVDYSPRHVRRLLAEAESGGQ